MQCFDGALCGTADVTVVTATKEAAALRQLAPGASVEVVPNGVVWECVAVGDEPRAPDGIVFTGKISYHANAVIGRVPEIGPVPAGCRRRRRH